MKGAHSLQTFQLVFTALLGHGRDLLSSVCPDSKHQNQPAFCTQTSYLSPLTTMDNTFSAYI